MARRDDLSAAAGGGAPAPAAGGATRWVPRTATVSALAVTLQRRPGRGATVVALALLGAWLGLLVGGSTTTPVGPTQARLSVVPALTGNTVVHVPPLGSLTFDTHDGPLGLTAEVVGVDTEDARRIVSNPASLEGLEQRIVDDLRAGLLELAGQATLAAVAGAALTTLLVLRRTRRAMIGGAVALAVAAGGALTAAATFEPRAVATPRYEGLLALAPTVVGDAEDIVANFDRYRQQLAAIVTNVSQLYGVAATLPAFSPSPDTVRVLHVSDIHLNPAAFDVMRSVAAQFQTDFVIDTGDFTDRGSAAEDRFADLIPTMGVPYVFIRGNHDSLGTERAVAAQPNAIVLRDGATAEVGGLRIIGAADPRFTPDKSTRARGAPPSLKEAGEALAAAAEREVAAGHRIDVALVHDPPMGETLDGLVPLVLAGHGHRRVDAVWEAGTRLFQQGSTGGAGLRGLEGEEPTPIQLSVLYFDRASGELQAWDDITVGGLGLTSAQIERQLAGEPPDGPEDADPEGPEPPTVVELAPDPGAQEPLPPAPTPGG